MPPAAPSPQPSVCVGGRRTARLCGLPARDPWEDTGSAWAPGCGDLRRIVAVRVGALGVLVRAGGLWTTPAVPPVPVCVTGMDACPAGATPELDSQPGKGTLLWWGPPVGASCPPRASSARRALGRKGGRGQAPQPPGVPVSRRAGPAAPSDPGLPAATGWHGLGWCPEQNHWACGWRRGGRRARGACVATV